MDSKDFLFPTSSPDSLTSAIARSGVLAKAVALCRAEADRLGLQMVAISLQEALEHFDHD